MNDARALQIIGELVREHRLRLGHSQQDFALRAGLRTQTLRFFEKGHRWPGEEVRRRIEEGLGWRPGSITQFRDQGQTGPGLDAALKTLRSIVPASPPSTDVQP
jgi:transcriptional regulator with XRE-family HTH domain